MNKEHLSIIGDFIGIFQQLVTADFNIAVCDESRIVAASPGRSIDLNLKVGDLVKDGAVGMEAIKSKKPVTRTVSREVYGIPYIGRAVPLFDNDHVIGAVIVAESTDSKDKLIQMAQNLSSTIEQITAAMQENASGLEKVASLGMEMEKISQTNLHSVNQTDKIVDTVYNIARQTKLLGLNASIESARAGEAGKGFKVVANEVGELAENSTNATKQINDLLEQLKIENNKVSDQSQELSQILSQLAASTEEISASTQSLSQMSDELVSMAENLT
jgi:methyl-accepting chemotaxis protein